MGNRRELFIDSALIESLKGSAAQRLHHPVPREVAINHFEDWEGTGSGYHSVFHDGEKYRMYYKAWHIEVEAKGINTGRHPLYCCYAESDDGIHWRKPNLGIVAHKGSKKNNITSAFGITGELKYDPGHPAVFMDENPKAAPDARFKAIFRSWGKRGLIPFKSADGFNWKPMSDEVIFHGLGAFDSQNLAFWDPALGKYRAYWRIFSGGGVTDKEWKPKGHRAIRTAVSDDMLKWTNVRDVAYEDSPSEQLYTNQIKHYHRAPHILIGFPNRYFDRGPSESMSALPDPENRKHRAAASPRYGHALSETLLMASRDGVHFKRWNEAFLRPGIERPGTWHYGAQYMAWHAVETKSTLPGAPNELSVYATEGYWHGKGSTLRRYSLRLDGFVSINGKATGGEVTTTPIKFSGKELEVNFSTSAKGGIRVELQDENGKPIPGYALDDCPQQFGDSIDRVISWKNGADLSKLAGKPIRIRFELKDADLYSYRFIR
ncbi:MAG: hypothetical protein CMO80_10030 [Verrucomicrobiales bacterium]|nr:hypothetical protein [Verrucomicrobiales bacterium]